MYGSKLGETRSFITEKSRLFPRLDIASLKHVPCLLSIGTKIFQHSLDPITTRHRHPSSLRARPTSGTPTQGECFANNFVRAADVLFRSRTTQDQERSALDPPAGLPPKGSAFANNFVCAADVLFRSQCHSRPGMLHDAKHIASDCITTPRVAY
jgi:hypothetical protein